MLCWVTVSHFVYVQRQHFVPMRLKEKQRTFKGENSVKFAFIPIEMVSILKVDQKFPKGLVY